VPYLAQVLADEPWPVVTTSDYVNALSERLGPWAPGRFVPLGTEGFGRSETRQALRSFFEIDAEHVAYTALTELAETDQIERKTLKAAIEKLGIDPDAADPAYA
jgi:pyruvate dehydrogenase E1 component